MAEKAKSTKRKERGVNVRVTQEKKATEEEKVRVNNNFESKAKKAAESAEKTEAKKTAEKSTAKSAEAKKAAKKPAVSKAVKKSEKSDKLVVEKTVAKKPEVKKVAEEPEVKKVAEKPEIKKEVMRPASFSKNLKILNEVKAPEIVLPNKALTNEALMNEALPNGGLSGREEPTGNFETLSLNADTTYSSRIIPRDVTRNRAEIENPPVPTAQKDNAKVAPATRRRFSANIFARESAQKARKLTAKEIKEREIKKAVSLANRLPKNGRQRQRKPDLITRFGWARLTLMITCVATAVFALVYFINLTSADMSLKVAASQSGIEATYPDYVPRGYELSDVTSASGKVTMNFKSEDGAFMITEEASNWNSEALYSNFIKENYADDEYSVVIEQGLTIYMGANWEAWVNGGLLYKLNVKSGSLTKKQLKTIATSL